MTARRKLALSLNHRQPSSQGKSLPSAHAMQVSAALHLWASTDLPGSVGVWTHWGLNHETSDTMGAVYRHTLAGRQSFYKLVWIDWWAPCWTEAAATAASPPRRQANSQTGVEGTCSFHTGPSWAVFSACVLSRENIHPEIDPGKPASELRPSEGLWAGPFSTKPNQHSMEILGWGPELSTTQHQPSLGKDCTAYLPRDAQQWYMRKENHLSVQRN